MYEAMKQVGRLLAGKGIVTATGAYGGSGMEAPIAGALEAGGEVVGYGFGVPDLEPNRFLKGGPNFLNMAEFRLIRTSAPDDYIMPHAEQQFGLRLGALLEADGFIVDASGQIGTIAELAAIINFGMKLWPKTIGHTKPVAILHPPSIPLGIGNGLLAILAAFGVCPAREKMPFLAEFDTPEEAFNWVSIRIGG